MPSGLELSRLVAPLHIIVERAPTPLIGQLVKYATLGALLQDYSSAQEHIACDVQVAKTMSTCCVGGRVWVVVLPYLNVLCTL